MLGLFEKNGTGGFDLISIYDSLSILAWVRSKESTEGLLELLEELWSGACGCAVGKVKNCSSIALAFIAKIKGGACLW